MSNNDWIKNTNKAQLLAIAKNNGIKPKFWWSEKMLRSKTLEVMRQATETDKE